MCTKFHRVTRLGPGHRQTQNCSIASGRRFSRCSSVLGGGAILLSEAAGHPVAMAAKKGEEPQEGDQPEDFRQASRTSHPSLTCFLGC